MTTTLSAVPVMDDQLDLLSAIADMETPLGKLHADDFERACRLVADSDGVIDPNHVSFYLHERFGEIKPQWFSAMWSASCGPRGFMDTLRDQTVPIDGRHSKGNGNKRIPLRRLRT